MQSPQAAALLRGHDLAVVVGNLALCWNAALVVPRGHPQRRTASPPPSNAVTLKSRNDSRSWPRGSQRSLHIGDLHGQLPGSVQRMSAEDAFRS